MNQINQQCNASLFQQLKWLFITTYNCTLFAGLHNTHLFLYGCVIISVTQSLLYRSTYYCLMNGLPLSGFEFGSPSPQSAILQAELTFQDMRLDLVWRLDIPINFQRRPLTMNMLDKFEKFKGLKRFILNHPEFISSFVINLCFCKKNRTLHVNL